MRQFFSGKRFHLVSGVLGAVLFIVAGAVLVNELWDLNWTQVGGQLAALPGWSIAAAVGLTFLAYLLMCGYDILAVRYVVREDEPRLSVPKIALTGFLSYVFSNNIGLSIVGATTLRLRLYSAFGLSPLTILKIIAFSSFSFWVGVVAVAGVTLMVWPFAWPTELSLGIGLGGQTPSWLIGLLLTAGVAVYLLTCLLWHKPVTIRGWWFSPPPARYAFPQPIVGMFDFVASASVFYVLILGTGVDAPPFGTLLAMYVLALTAGLVSHVPGGLGVFDTIMLLLLKPYMGTATVMSTLVAYRLAYYLLPLAVATLMLVVFEFQQHGPVLKRASLSMGRRLRPHVPALAGCGVFVTGAMLFWSGVLPTEWLQPYLDNLSARDLEVSQVLTSVAGLGMLLAARWLHRSFRSLHLATATLLTFAVLAAATRGFDGTEMGILALAAVTLYPVRRLV